MPSETTITVGLSNEEKKAIQDAAKANDTTVSVYLKRLFSRHIPGFHYTSTPENRGGDKRSWVYRGVFGWVQENEE